jgi:hypothetical protein
MNLIDKLEHELMKNLLLNKKALDIKVGKEKKVLKFNFCNILFIKKNKNNKNL